MNERKPVRLVAARAAARPDPITQWAERKAQDIRVEACGWRDECGATPQEVAAALRQVAAEVHEMAARWDPEHRDATILGLRLAIRQSLGRTVGRPAAKDGCGGARDA